MATEAKVPVKFPQLGRGGARRTPRAFSLRIHPMPLTMDQKGSSQPSSVILGWVLVHNQLWAQLLYLTTFSHTCVRILACQWQIRVFSTLSLQSAKQQRSRTLSVWRWKSILSSSFLPSINEASMGVGAGNPSVKNKTDKNPCPHRVYILAEKTEVEWDGPVYYLEHCLW